MAPDDGLIDVAVDRSEALAVLAAGPYHRRELEAELGVSKTTCHRIVRAFDEHGLVRRTDDGYALTAFGRVVAHRTTSFEAHLETAARLQPLLDLLDDWAGSFDPSLFADDEADWRVHGEESYSIDQGLELVEGIDILRVLDWTPVPDLYQEKILRILTENEVDAESIYPAAEVEDRLERFPELHDDFSESGARPRYWVCEDVPPWGLSIYDDSLVELRAYDQQSGAYVMSAVSESDRAVEWGLDVFRDYRERATPVTEIEDLPDWGDYSW